MIVSLFITGFIALLSPVTTGLNAVQLPGSTWSYIGAVAAYVRIFDTFFPVTDGLLPVLALWFAVANAGLAKQIVVFIVNVVRGSGAKL